MIRIALADDHTIFRKGVSELISRFPDMSVVMEAGNGQELTDLLKTAKNIPDICVLDINMPVMNGYETAAAIKKKWPQVKILALSMYDTELNVIKMLRNGANGYILKDADPQEFRTALEQIHQHGFYHSELVTGRMLRVLQQQADEPQIDISDKEMKFLALCCSELTYKQIAEEMFLSPRTIDGYRESLFAKLDVTSRTGLAIYAIKAGLVSI